MKAHVEHLAPSWKTPWRTLISPCGPEVPLSHEQRSCRRQTLQQSFQCATLLSVTTFSHAPLLCSPSFLLSHEAPALLPASTVAAAHARPAPLYSKPSRTSCALASAAACMPVPALAGSSRKEARSPLYWQRCPLPPPPPPAALVIRNTAMRWSGNRSAGGNCSGGDSGGAGAPGSHTCSPSKAAGDEGWA